SASSSRRSCATGSAGRRSSISATSAARAGPRCICRCGCECGVPCRPPISTSRSSAADGDRAMRDRVALVTGASRGLGRATAIALAERGMKVVLSAPTLAEAEATVAELDARLGIVARQLDVSRDEQVAALFDELHQQFGRLDVLVNNAGIIPEGPGATALEVPATLVAEALNVNALGPYRTCQRALPW